MAPFDTCPVTAEHSLIVAFFDNFPFSNDLDRGAFLQQKEACVCNTNERPIQEVKHVFRRGAVGVKDDMLDIGMTRNPLGAAL